MDERRAVVVGGGAGVGELLRASVARMGDRIITVIDTPEMIVKGSSCYVPTVDEGHYRLTPTRRSRKHWHDLRTFLHQEVKADRRREIQAARRHARRAMRRAAK